MEITLGRMKLILRRVVEILGRMEITLGRMKIILWRVAEILGRTKITLGRIKKVKKVDQYYNFPSGLTKYKMKM